MSNEYYWVANTANGDSIYQLNEDGSITEFKEILDKEVIAFHLSNGKRTFTVDLRTGMFFLDDTPLLVHSYDEYNLINRDEPYRLIYYRRKRKETGVDAKYDGEPYIHAYILGWQLSIPKTRIEFLNYQRMLFIYPETDAFEMRNKR